MLVSVKESLQCSSWQCHLMLLYVVVVKAQALLGSETRMQLGDVAERGLNCTI